MFVATRPFRTSDSFPSLNLQDDNVGGEWTSGASLLDHPDLQVPGITSISIIAVAFSCSLLCQSQGAGIYGKLGKLIGGISTTNQQSPTGGGSYPQDRSIQPLPTDANLFTTIWDGSKDELPPVSGMGGTDLTTVLPVSAAVQPAVPIEVQDITSLLVGLWLTPSLVSSVSTLVAKSTYSLLFTAKGIP